MPKQRLHDAQIGAIVQEVAGESMAEHMRAHSVAAQSCTGREAFQVPGEMLSRDMPALAERGEKPFRVARSCLRQQGKVFVHRQPWPCH